MTDEENNLLPTYVSPMVPGAAQMTVDVQEFLEEPAILEGFTRPEDSITPKIWELKFEDYNTKKKDLSRN